MGTAASGRALVFGSKAAAYERYRPGYPTEVVAAVLDHATSPVRRALEIGAGTGQATRVFAAHGIEIVATEPDPAMIAQLRRHVPPTTTVVRSSFEDLTPTSTFDLVYAAAAMHWTRPDGRWDRVAALLEPGGLFASLGGSARRRPSEGYDSRSRVRTCSPRSRSRPISSTLVGSS